MELVRNNNSTEDYLKNILILHARNGCVRAVDLAVTMGVTKPSVSAAMKKLRGKKMIYINENGHICLTDEGRAIAEKVNNKHELIKDFLMKIGVNEVTASDDACRIEHAIGEETFERLGEFCSNNKELSK